MKCEICDKTATGMVPYHLRKNGLVTTKKTIIEGFRSEGEFYTYFSFLEGRCKKHLKEYKKELLR